MIQGFLQIHLSNLNPNFTAFHVNANKVEYTCFKQEGSIFTLCGWPIKRVDEFIFLNNNISSTKKE